MLDTLHLILKKKWFDMILAREKPEEYRDMTPYWKKRIEKARRLGVKTVTFSNGYAKDRRQFVIKLESIETGQGKAKWGAAPGEVYFVLKLGHICWTKNCNE